MSKGGYTYVFRWTKEKINLLDKYVNEDKLPNKKIAKIFNVSLCVIENAIHKFGKQRKQKRKPVKKLFENGYIKKSKNKCWIWLKYKNHSGYGVYGRTVRGKTKLFLAHRLSWMLYKGKIPKGMCVCHTCDNPPCVNPNHLFLGTQLKNIQDRTKKERSAKGSNNIGNKKLTEEQVKNIKKSFNKSTIKEIAQKYNTHISTIYSIKYKKTWGYIK